MSKSLYGLDIDLACRQLNNERYGDWYRDPWSWFEIGIVKGHPEILQDSVMVKNRPELAHTPSMESYVVPKSLLGVRPASISDVGSRIVYTAACKTLTSEALTQMPDWVFAWRWRTNNSPVSNGYEWKEFVNSVQTMDTTHMLKTDITSYFHSIKPKKLLEGTLRNKKGFPRQIVETMLNAQRILPDRNGFPQRFTGSAWLANCYLQPVDRYIQTRVASGKIKAARWMDDIYIGGSEEDLYDTFLGIEDRMRQLELEPNLSKSILADSTTIKDELRHIEDIQNAVDEPLPLVSLSAAPMLQKSYKLEQVLTLQTEILAAPDIAPRSLVRFVLRALRETGKFGSVDQWLNIAHRIPSCADYLSRYFRDAAHDDTNLSWASYQGWLDALTHTKWLSTPWVDFQLTAAIPSNKFTSDTYSRITGWISPQTDSLRFGLASQRISAINRDELEDIYRERASQISSSFHQRHLGLAMANAPSGPQATNDMLALSDVNRLTLEAVKVTKMSPPAVANDFDPIMQK